MPKHRTPPSARRRTYAQVYTTGYGKITGRASASPDAFSSFIKGLMTVFRRKPREEIRTPGHVMTMMRTQSVVQKMVVEKDALDAVEFALRLVRFMQRRAANIINTRALNFLYRPNGWFYHKCAADFSCCLAEDTEPLGGSA